MGLLNKIFGGAIADKNDPGGSGFEDNVYRERKGLLGKVMPYITPKDKRR